MRPYKTNPLLVERIWGGKSLLEYNKKLGEKAIGESWETGSLEGNNPVLIKLIDAKESLSVQVHPDDEFARRAENRKNGKSEAWVVLDCDEDSFIICGFNRPIKKEEFRKLLEEGRITQVLNYIKVRKGDYIYIPAGTIHSLGKGVLVYEVQQPSDLTYRIYDWDRTDSQGKKRELHIDKAVDAIDYSSELPRISNIYDASRNGVSDIVDCRYFKSSFGTLQDKERHNYETGLFRAVTVISGNAVLESEETRLSIRKGDTCIIPADYNRTVFVEGLGAAEYIVTTCSTKI